MVTYSMKKADLKLNEETDDSKIVQQRRSFLKKAAYVAPTLIALGALTRPTDAKAGFGRPPSGPNWN